MRRIEVNLQEVGLGDLEVAGNAVDKAALVLVGAAQRVSATALLGAIHRVKGEGRRGFEG